MARAAGRLLTGLRDSRLLAGRPLGAAGDRLSQELLSAVLAHRRPRDPMLSEESRDDRGRLASARVWILDPLDGTSEYAEGREDFAVHVALCEQGLPVAGAIAIPAREELWASDELRCSQAWRSACEPAQATAEPSGRRLRIAISRSRPPAQAEPLAARLGAELVALGSAGFKTAAVLRGDVDAYLHAGGQFEWDSAAPAAVALAAGLHASRIDGSPLRYNRPDPRLPDLLICRAALAERLLGAIAALG
jgi:3'(2'), 5'-bisphosphate nucleotidase